MKLIKNEHCIFFDVDDTLIMWNKDAVNPDAGYVLVADRHLPINNANVDKLIEMHYKGQFVVVWSAAGYKWAKTVVEALNLVPFVDLIMTKPRVYFDDLPVQTWMNRLYYGNEKYNSNGGK